MRVKGCQIHRYVAFKAALALSCARNQTSGGGLRIESKIDNQRIEQYWTNTKIDTIYYLANGIADIHSLSFILKGRYFVKENSEIVNWRFKYMFRFPRRKIILWNNLQLHFCRNRNC
jgi:hypothetical protein